MTAINDFCEKRLVPKPIRSAFIAYCKTDYATKFDLLEGDTINRFVNDMSEFQVQEAWNQFVRDFKTLLPSEQ